MAIYLRERGIVAAKLETTKGTANAPAAVDGGIEVYTPSLNTDITVMERDPVRASFDDALNITGNRISKLTFKTPLVGGSTAGSRPQVWQLLRGCALTEAIVAATSVTYTVLTASASQETLTIDVYLDGILHRMTGAMGNVKVTVMENETPMMEFDFTGVYNAPTDTALLASVAYNATSPPAPLNATLAFRSQTLTATGWTFDLGNEVQPRQDITKASGVAHFVVVNRKPVYTASPEIETIATFDFWSSLVNATAGVFTGTVGTVAGNTIRLQSPMSQITAAAPGDRNGLLILNLTIKPRAATSAGEDAWTLRYS